MITQSNVATTMNIKARLHRTLIAFFFCFPFSVPAGAAGVDVEQPIEFSADQGDFDLAESGESAFIGNVVITQGTLRVESDRATTRRENGIVVDMTFVGSPVRLWDTTSDGQPITARARNVIYDVEAQSLLLSGSVEVHDPRGYVKGERIVYDINSKRLRAGQDSGRINMRVLPRSSRAEP